jgi:hypothetical protein
MYHKCWEGRPIEKDSGSRPVFEHGSYQKLNNLHALSHMWSTTAPALSQQYTLKQAKYIGCLDTVKQNQFTL